MMMTAAKSVSAWAVWSGRLRFVFATALVWASLHFIVGGFLLPEGLDRPLVLASARFGPLTGLLVAGLLCAGGALIARLPGVRDRREPLFILGLALALWVAEGGRHGGTFDAWLILRNESPGPPARGAYVVLLADYIYLLLGVGGAFLLSTRRAATAPRLTTETAAPPQLKSAAKPAAERRQGLIALLITTIAAGVVTNILMGPAVGATLRGQVYFAVFVGLMAGAYLAMRVTNVRDPRWYWPAPFLLGFVGLVAAMINPALMLPPEYRQLNVIPAWGLARALPTEMVGVGLVGVLWLLHEPETRVATESGQ